MHRTSSQGHWREKRAGGAKRLVVVLTALAALTAAGTAKGADLEVEWRPPGGAPTVVGRFDDVGVGRLPALMVQDPSGRYWRLTVDVESVTADRVDAEVTMHLFRGRRLVDAELWAVQSMFYSRDDGSRVKDGKERSSDDPSLDWTVALALVVGAAKPDDENIGLHESYE